LPGKGEHLPQTNRLWRGVLPDRPEMNAIVIMAREPVPQQVKTRLCPSLTPEAAARLYECFLLDTIELVRNIESVRRIVAYTPKDAGAYFRSIVPEGFALIYQKGADLGERLAHASRSLFDRGCAKVILIGSDSPNLPPGYIREGFCRLDEADVVLGPCEDGGYYLIGMRSAMPDLFAGVPWSSSAVTQATVEKAMAARATVSLLEEWYDVDRYKDLFRLKRDLDSTRMGQDGRLFCIHTHRALSRMEGMQGPQGIL